MTYEFNGDWIEACDELFSRFLIFTLFKKGHFFE